MNRLNTNLFSILTLGLLLCSCKTTNEKDIDYQISLAQWSHHKAFFEGEYSTLDFPRIASENYNIKAIEYVNQFFKDKARDFNYLQQLKDSCKKYDVTSVLIMVDGEGSLSSSNKEERQKAVHNHHKWVDAAKFLDCHSIRINLHGDVETEEEWVKNSIAGLTELVKYGESKKINIIVENHGQWSSKGKLVKAIMDSINNPYCGTLPDFGNFCVRRRDGDLWVSPCVEWYDRYAGVEEMLPYAKGISAKSFDFDSLGNETSTDFSKMLTLAKNAKYTGYIGIEYEGEKMSEKNGIIATKALLEKLKTEL